MRDSHFSRGNVIEPEVELQSSNVSKFFPSATVCPPDLEDEWLQCPTAVSIVIPTYNRSVELINAIESALQQTHPNCEIIVVDDGSTDDTVEKVTPYLNRIRYFYQDNQGVAAALNKGIEVARGRWIAVLASDDLWLPNKLESQFKALAKLGEEYGACFTDCRYVGNSAFTLSAFQEAQLECPSECGPLRKPQEYVLARHAALYVQSMLISRSLLQKVNGFDTGLVVGEDTDLLFRLAFHTKFCVVREPLVKIDRTSYRPRLTDLYTSGSDTAFACHEYKYNKWLGLPELTDHMTRKIIQNSRRCLYYDRIVASLYKFDLAEAFVTIGQLQKTGHSFLRIAVTLLFRAARKMLPNLSVEERVGS
jgi:glycosyltransferase involved in cell wall biosynthesis